MTRYAITTLLLASACTVQSGTSVTGTDGPIVTAIEGPTDIAATTSAPIVIHVLARANEQLSIAVTAELGAFEVRERMVTTGADGTAVFPTTYIAGAASGRDTIAANVGDLSGHSDGDTHTLTIHPNPGFGQPRF